MKRKILCYILLALVISYNILDVYAITNDNSSNPNPSGELDNSQFIKINETVEIDKEIIMTLYLDNISYDNFTFKLYSNNSLEEVNTKDIDLTNFNNEEISFDYCINCSSLKTISLNYKLPTTIEIGDKITFNVQLVNKDNTEEVMNYRGTVTVIDTIKKEEEKEINDKTEQEKNMKGKSSFSGSGMNFSGNNSGSVSKSNASTTYKGSSNNYLSNITIKGYTLNKSFIKERLTYFVTVPNSVKSLNISATKEDSNASVNISGNSNFNVGVNKVLITVTSQDGRIKNYRIYVTRMDSDANEE